jgi:hypothetical protein
VLNVTSSKQVSNGTFELQRILNLKAKENINQKGQNMNLKVLKHRKSASPMIPHVIKSSHFSCYCC